MKNALLVIFVLAAIAYIYFRSNPKVDFKEDPEGGIQFHKGDWQAALDLAKKENKLVFLDIYATWCGPCKQLKKYTFTDKEAGDYFNANFVNVALDGEQDEGSILAQKFELNAYPTLFFINSDGQLISKSVGYLSATDLVKIGKEVKGQIQ
jgi:thioredoxin 1